jgi:AP-3 complex subunit beta
MFEPYLKSFYIHSSDPTNIRLLKLDIIANVAGESSIHTILREFRTYISSPDKQFAAATIEAIGRVACSISEVTETCLHGLMSLLSHKSENVVAQSVVVIKKLLQLHPKQNKDLIDQVARLADSVTVPMAKASILWLVGEYCSLVPKMGPDVLRKAAKNFVNESDIVKLQTVNLAAKLVLSNPKQTRLLCDYVLSLAKYDQNYDIRDRARFLKQLVTPPEGEETALSKYAKKILLAPKPAPVLESAFKGYNLAFLSFLLVWAHGLLTKCM